MAQKIAARGRPKGTGLNDADRLAAMARMIAANPGMKPTTAIKAMGITNPSVIRRLRDKYNQLAAHGSGTETASHGAKSPGSRHNVVQLRTRTAPPCSGTPDRAAIECPPPHRQSHRRTGGAATNSAGGDSPTAEAAADDHPATARRPSHQDLFSAALAAGVSAAQAAIDLQFKTLSYALQGSPAACFLRGQEFMRLMTASLEDQAAKTRCSRPSS
jgi:hypothetical protein